MKTSLCVLALCVALSACALSPLEERAPRDPFCPPASCSAYAPDHAAAPQEPESARVPSS